MHILFNVLSLRYILSLVCVSISLFLFTQYCVQSGQIRSVAFLKSIILFTVYTAAKYYLRPGLRSSSTNNYILPRLQSRLGERAFSYAGPLAWNSLPADLQNIPDTLAFKKHLKTHLFNCAF